MDQSAVYSIRLWSPAGRLLSVWRDVMGTIKVQFVQHGDDKGLAGGGPGAPAPFVAACHLYFNAAADFQKGIAAHGTEIMGDIPNYTDISPEIQISEIVVG